MLAPSQSSTQAPSAPAPQQVSEHGAGQFMHPPVHAAPAPTMNGFGPMQPQAHDANSFAVARLNQLKAMGINPWQAAGGQGPSGAAALWRQMSPLMGALIQGQHGGIQEQTQNALSHFSPQVQALVQSVLSRNHAAQGIDSAVAAGMQAHTAPAPAPQHQAANFFPFQGFGRYGVEY